MSAIAHTASGLTPRASVPALATSKRSAARRRRVPPPSGCGRSCACRGRAPARCSSAARLRRANERAHELAVDLRRDNVGVDALVGEELARILHAIDARRLEADRLEAGLGELVAVLALLEGAGD